MPAGNQLDIGKPVTALKQAEDALVAIQAVRVGIRRVAGVLIFADGPPASPEQKLQPGVGENPEIAIVRVQLIGIQQIRRRRVVRNTADVWEMPGDPRAEDAVIGTLRQRFEECRTDS